MRIYKLLTVALVIAVAYGIGLDAKPASGQSTYNIHSAAVYQPGPEVMEVFSVGLDGAVRVVWKERNSNWRPPYSITGPGFATPGAPIAAVFQPRNNQVEVFVIGTDGAIWIIWKANQGPWSPPGRLTEPNVSRSTGGIAAVVMPGYDMLEVFYVGSDGAVWDVFKANNGRWNAPFRLTREGFAREGDPLAATYTPVKNTIEVFVVRRDGTVWVIPKEENRAWQQPLAISPPGFAGAGSNIAAVAYHPFENVEVFVVGSDGRLKGLYRTDGIAWKSDLVFGAPGFAPSEAPIAAVHYPRNDQLEVFVVDSQGALTVTWKAQNGRWNGPARITGTNNMRAGVPLSAVFQELADHLEVFAVADDWKPRGVWKARNGAWQQPFDLTAPYFSPFKRPADCSTMLQRWTNGGVNTRPPDWDWEYCMWVMGFEGHCRTKGGYTVVEYRGNDKSIVCAPFARPQDFLEEFTAVAVGSLQMVATVLQVAAVVVSCLKIPNPFTCALIPITLGQLSGADLGPTAEGVRIVSEVTQCATLDITSCVSLGQRGLQAAGINIPGLNPGEIGAAFTSCKQDNFAGCMRLAFGAVEAAGVDTRGAAQILDFRGCLNGNADACLALGTKAARSKHLPLRDIADGVQRGQRCLEGDAGACLSLGGDISRQAGFPLADVLDGVNRGRKCIDGDNDACIGLATDAARAVDFPLNGVFNSIAAANRCANLGQNAACLDLGRALIGSALPDGTENAVRCAAGNNDACQALGDSLVKSGIAHAVAASGPFNDSIRATACGQGNPQACQELARAFIRR